MAFIASLLGFGVTIMALILSYAYAFQGIVWLVGQVTGATDTMTRMIIAFVLIFVFVALASKVGRFARDWIEAGRTVQRRPAR